MNNKAQATDYLIGGLIALIVLVIIAIIFFTNYQVYFEDIKQITEEVFQWTAMKYKDTATAVSTNTIKNDMEFCRSEKERECYCLISKTNLPKNSKVWISNNKEGSKVIAINEEDKVIGDFKFKGGDFVGVVERRGSELVCTIPDYDIAIESDQTNHWRLVEKRKEVPEQSYSFLEEPVEYYSIEGVDQSGRPQSAKTKVFMPGLYKPTDNLICLVTEKFIVEDSINDAHYINKPVKIADLKPLQTSSLELWQRIKIWVESTYKGIEYEVYNAIEFLSTSAPCSPLHAMPNCPRPTSGLTKKQFKELVEGVALEEQQKPSALWAEIREKKELDWSSATVNAEFIYERAVENNIDPYLLFALIAASSGFNTAIISPNKERAGIMYLTEKQIQELELGGYYSPAQRQCCNVNEIKKDPRYDNRWAIGGGAILAKDYKEKFLNLKHPRCSIEEVAAAFRTDIDSIIIAGGVPDDKGVIDFVRDVCKAYQLISGNPCRPIETITKQVPKAYKEEYKKRYTEGNFIIVLDPGHGGEDYGTVNKKSSLKEKGVNLKHCLLLRDGLKNYKGVVVEMTRDSDLSVGTNMQLSERTRFATEKNADILISCHNDQPGGKRIIIYPKNEVVSGYDCSNKRCERSEKLAKSVKKELDTATGKIYSDDVTYCWGKDDVKVRCGVLQGEMPSVIIEYAPIDASELTSDTGLKKMAKAVTEGVINYAVSEGFLNQTVAQPVE